MVAKAVLRQAVSLGAAVDAIIMQCQLLIGSGQEQGRDRQEQQRDANVDAPPGERGQSAGQSEFDGPRVFGRRATIPTMTHPMRPSDGEGEEQEA